MQSSFLQTTPTGRSPELVFLAFFIKRSHTHPICLAIFPKTLIPSFLQSFLNLS